MVDGGQGGKREGLGYASQVGGLRPQVGSLRSQVGGLRPQVGSGGALAGAHSFAGGWVRSWC